jgi:hypothetical protein
VVALGFLLVSAALAPSAHAAASCVDQARAAFDASQPSLYGPKASYEQAKSLAAIEQESLLFVANCVHCPQKPFGNANGKWLEFKQRAKPGDCIVLFSTNPGTWERQEGRKGYALLREGRIVDTFVMLRN